MTLADPVWTNITSIASVVATGPLYLVIWKASAAFKDVQKEIQDNTEAIAGVVGTLKEHGGRIGDLELAKAHEEGRAQGMEQGQHSKPLWDGHERRRAAR